jgi:hypothetical protein
VGRLVFSIREAVRILLDKFFEICYAGDTMKTLRNFVCIFGLFWTIIASAAEKYTVKTQHGMASWYGTFHQGRVMANGNKFDKRKLTAANRVLPLGTRVLVTFKNHTIVVTVKIGRASCRERVSLEV